MNIEAYKRGQTDFNRGIRRDQNPYFQRTATEWLSWDCGWTDSHQAWLNHGNPELY